MPCLSPDRQGTVAGSSRHPDRFRRVVASNTGFDTGDEDLSQAWPHLAQWFQLTQRADPLDVGGIVETYSTPPLDPAVRAGYDAPLPDNAHLEGVRRFPLLIPISGDDENSPALRDAWEVLATLETPFLCAFSDGDHVTGGDHSALSGHIAGAQGQPHTTIAGARHFLQENKGPSSPPSSTTSSAPRPEGG